MLFLEGAYAIEGERLCFRRASAPIHATLEVLVHSASASGSVEHGSDPRSHLRRRPCLMDPGSHASTHHRDSVSFLYLLE